MQANLLVIKDIVNVYIFKDFFCFISDDGKRDKISSEIIDLFKRKFFLMDFFEQCILQFILNIIIAILLKLA